MRPSSARIWLLLILAAATAPLLARQEPASFNSIHGVVRDERGRPMAGVTVQAVLRQKVTSPPVALPERDIARTTTDFTGSYRLDRLAAGAYVVFVYASHDSSVSNREYIPNVAPGSIFPTYPRYRFLPEPTEATEVKGVYSLVDITGRFRLYVSPGLTPWQVGAEQYAYGQTYSPGTARLDAATRFVVPSSNQLRGDIAMRTVETQRVVGRIDGGGPFKGNLRLNLTNDTDTVSAVSEEDGSFVLMGVPLGSYRLTIENFSWSHVGFQPTRWATTESWIISKTSNGAIVRLLDSGNPIGRLTISTFTQDPLTASAPTDGGSVSGIVLDSSQAPLSRVRLRLSTVRSDDREYTATTDDTGRYVFRGVGSGVYHLDATRDGFGTVRYGQRHSHEDGTVIRVFDTKHFDATPIVFSAGAISGTLIDGQGRPIANTFVRSGFVEDFTDAAGRFRLTGIAPGQQQVRTYVHRDSAGNELGFNRRVSRDVNVQANADASDVVLQLPNTATGSIRFRLTRKGDLPIGYAFLNLSGPNFITSRILHEPTATEATVQIPMIPTGRYSATAGTQGSISDSVSRDVEVVNGTPSTVDFELGDSASSLADGGTVVFRVKNESEGNIRAPAREWRGWLVKLSDTDDEPVYQPVDFVGETMRQIGRLRAGRYMFVVDGHIGAQSSGMLDGVDVMDTPFELGRNGRREIQLTVRQRYHNVDADVVDAAGKATADATLVVFTTNRDLWNSQSRRIKMVRPEIDGRAIAYDLPDDSYYVIAIPMWPPEAKPDAAFFERLAAKATTLTFTKERGQRDALTLKVTPID